MSKSRYQSHTRLARAIKRAAKHAFHTQLRRQDVAEARPEVWAVPEDPDNVVQLRPAAYVDGQYTIIHRAPLILKRA